MSLAAKPQSLADKTDGRVVGPTEELVAKLVESGKDPRLAFGRTPDSGLLELISDGFGLFFSLARVLRIIFLIWM